jgi:hypothetical protein
MATEAPVLTPRQARRFAVVKALLVGSLAGSAVAFLAGVGLLFLPGASTALRATAWAIFIEMAVSGAVLGALARCPACGGRLGGQSRGLLPARCPRCGVVLQKAA